MSFLRKYFLHSPGHYVAALVLNICFTLLVLFLKGFDWLRAYMDAFSVAGAISFLYGMLLWVSAAGAFYTFGYAFSYFRGERAHKDYYEYTNAKREKQATKEKIHVPYMVVGVVFLLISFVISRIVGTV